MNFLCTVSPRFPENYHIGVQAGVWGVEEKYEKRIRQTDAGDLLLFSVGGHLRSLHRIESEVYTDHTELWPPKDRSVFPLRIRISPALATGDVPLSSVSERISFMMGKRWAGTIQGANGVFNDRLSDEDLELIRSRMQRASKPVTVPAPKKRMDRIPIEFFEEQIEAAVARLLEELGCERGAPLRVREPQIAPHAHFTVFGHDRRSGDTVVVVLDGGAGNSSVLLHTLRNMSAVRQRSDGKSGVRGVILTGRLSTDLLLATREIPNLSVREYDLRLELGPEPVLNGSFEVA